MNGFFGDGTTWSTLPQRWCGKCKFGHLEFRNSSELMRVFCNKKYEWIRDEHSGDGRLMNIYLHGCNDDFEVELEE